MAFLKEWKENNPQEFEDELAWETNPDRPDGQAKPEAWKFETPVRAQDAIQQQSLSEGQNDKPHAPSRKRP